MFNRRIVVVGASLWGSTVFGCSADPPTVGDPTATIRSTFSANIVGETPVQDEKGHLWIGHPITDFASGKAFAMPANETPSITKADLDALSDEVYARDFWAPVKLVGDELGHAAEYRLAEIDAATVQAVHEAREKERRGVNMISFGPKRIVEFTGDNPPSLPPDSIEENLTPLVFSGQEHWLTIKSNSFQPFKELERSTLALGRQYSQFVASPDNREYLPHSTWTTYPWPHISSLLIKASSGGGGSATSIGQYTAISAAHCFFKQFADTFGPAGWYTFAHSWNIGRIHTVAFDPITFTGTDTISGSPTYSQCYSVTIPSSYANGVIGVDDFAILDFASCAVHPGAAAGWVNPGYSSSLQAYNATQMMMTAYDHDYAAPELPNQGAGTYASPRYVRDTMIYRAVPSGSSWAGPNIYQLNSIMSVEHGASGGGALGYLYGQLLWLGDLTEAWGGYNTWRTLTGGSWGFIRQWSNEF